MFGSIGKTFLGLLAKGAGSKVAKIFGGNKITPESLFRLWKNLGPVKRDEIRKSFLKQTKIVNQIKALMKEGILKRELGKALSTQEHGLIDMYEYFLMFEKKVERKKVHSKSGWLIWAEYHPQSKTCFIKMRNGKMIYPFFGVPKSKWLALCELGGDFMWNKFGRLYSARPRNWIRR